MPDGPAKQLLTKITLDQSDFNSQVASIRSILKSVAADIKQANTEQAQHQKDTIASLRQQFAEQRAAAQTSKTESDELYTRMKSRYDSEFKSLKELYAQKGIGESEFVAKATALNKKMYENEYVLIKGRYDAERSLLSQTTNEFIRDEKKKQLALEESMEILKAQQVSAMHGEHMVIPPPTRAPRTPETIVSSGTTLNAAEEMAVIKERQALLRASAATEKTQSDEAFAKRKLQYAEELELMKSKYAQGEIGEKEYTEQASLLNKKMYDSERLWVTERYEVERKLNAETVSQALKGEKEKQLASAESLELIKAQQAATLRQTTIVRPPVLAPVAVEGVGVAHTAEEVAMLKEKQALLKAETATERAQAEETFARKKVQYAEEMELLKGQFAQRKIGEQEYAAQALATNQRMYESERLLITERYDIERRLNAETTSQALKAEKEKQIALAESIELIKAQQTAAAREAVMVRVPAIVQSNVGEIAASRQRAQEEIAQARLVHQERMSEIEQESLENRAAYAKKEISEKEFNEVQKRLSLERIEAQKALLTSTDAIKRESLAKEMEGEKLRHETMMLDLQKEMELRRLSAASARSQISMRPEAPGMMERGTAGLMRGGLGGMTTAVMGGVLGGGLALMGVEMAIAKFRELSEMLKENAKAAETEVQLFGTLQNQMGGNREKSEEFVMGLKKASQGLVDEGALMRLAVVALRSNLHMSTGEVEHLTSAVARLAIGLHGAQGAQEAVRAVTQFLETGRGWGLAKVVGMSPKEVQQGYRAPRGSTPEEAELGRTQALLKKIFEMYEKAAPPVETLGLAMEREKLQMDELQHMFVRLIQQTPAAVKFFDAITDAVEKAQAYIVTHSEELENDIKGFISGAVKFASVLTAIGTSFIVMSQALLQTPDIIELLYDKWMSFLSGVGESLADLSLKIAKAVPAPMQGGEEKKAKNVKEAENWSTAAKQVHTEYTAKTEAKVTDVFAGSDARDRLEKAGIGLASTLWGIAKQVDAAKSKKAEGLLGQEKQPPDPTLVERQAKEAEAHVLAQIHRESEAKKAAAELDLKNQEEMHKLGQTSDEEYTKNRLAIYQRMYDDQKKAAVLEYGAAMALVDKENATTAEKLNDRKKAVDKYLEEVQKANEEYTSKKQVVGFEAPEEAQRHQQEAVALTHQTATDQLKESRQQTEEQYGAGTISLDQKLAKERDYFSQSALEAGKYYADQMALAGASVDKQAKAYAELMKQLDTLRQEDLKMEADVVRQKEALAQQAAKEAIEDAKEKYAAVQELVQTQQISPVEAAQQTRGAIGGEVTAQKGYIGVLQSQLNELASTVGGTTTPKFLSLSKELDDAQKALLGFEKALKEAQTPLQAAFGQLGELFQAIVPALGKRTGTGYAPFTGGSEIATGFGALVSGLSMGPGTPAALAAQAVSTFQTAPIPEAGQGALPYGAGSTSLGLSTPAAPQTSLEQQFSSLAQGITPLISGFSELTQTLQNSKLTVGQALGAGVGAGAKIGGDIGGMMKQLSGGATTGFMGALGSMSQFMGPIMGIVGGLVSTISAIFERAARRIADSVQNAIYQINLNFEEGSATLATTLTAIEAQRASLIQQESGVKGGQQYLNEMLPGINQQIAQLIQQQQQIINTFEAQTEVLNLGPGFSDVASQIENIISQWNQYISAGGNVVTANQFLIDSFQQLDETTINQLDQSYESALQNALQYNQLLIQRQQLVQSSAEQEESIMNQGVLVRQYTTAQTKAFQIGQIQEQTNQQLQQLDEQIQVSQYQLQTQNTIFNLVGTQVDLQNRLAQVQMQVINYDMIRISALAALVQQMGPSGTGAPLGSLITQLIATFSQGIGATGTSYTQLAAVMSALGLASGSNNATSTATNSPLQALFNQYQNQLGRQGSYAAATPTTGVPGAQ